MHQVSCSWLYAPRVCFWSVALGSTITKNMFLVSCSRLYMHQENVSGQLLSALYALKVCFWLYMHQVSCSRLYAPRVCFWSVALGFTCTKNIYIFLVNCSLLNVPRVFFLPVALGFTWIKNMFLGFMRQEYFSCQLLSALHAPRICFWSVALEMFC